MKGETGHLPTLSPLAASRLSASVSDASFAARPKITIVTPSFNQGKYLEETICSVLDQRYPNIEYIIVDGGSTDDSVEIIRKYEKHLAWWVSEKDRGQSHAINKGFLKATGQIYGYLNSDDLLEPDSLSAVAETFGAGAEWIIGVVRSFAEDGSQWEYRASPDGSRVEWLTTQALPQPAVFWSSSLYRTLGPFREDLHYVFDGEFFLRIRLKAGIAPVMVDRVLAAFRFHAACKTVAEGDRFEPEKRAVRAEYCRDLPAWDRFGVWAGERRMRGERQRSIALKRVAAGDARGAFSSVLAAVRAWPPLLCSRATAGVVKRSLISRLAGSRRAPVERANAGR